MGVMEYQPQKPRFVIPAENSPEGNVYWIIGTVQNMLRKEVSREAAVEFYEKAIHANSYEEVLRIVRSYCEVK